MKNIVLILGIILLTISVNAQEKKNKNAKVEFHVSGNCEMCKIRIEKAAYSVAGIKTANWHIDNETLYLIMNENKTDVGMIQKAIAKVGYDTQDLKATEEAYSKLPDCCAYDRE